MNKKFSFSRKRNRQFEFEAKLQYARAAAPCAAASSTLQFPMWCRILEIARTSAAAPTGGAKPPQENGAAKPHRSKTAKEPGEKHRRKPFSFGAGIARSEFVSGKRKLFGIPISEAPNRVVGFRVSRNLKVCHNIPMSIGTIALVAAVAFVVWGIYALVKDMRRSKAPTTMQSSAVSPPSKWTAGRIFAYIALTPVFLLCLFVALFFLMNILVPSTCSGGVCTSPLDSFGISMFGLGWIVGLFLLPLCVIVIPFAGGIVLLFRPSIAAKVIGVVLLLGSAYFAWEFRMLWFPIVGIGPSSAEISANEAQQEVDVEAKRQTWIQTALRDEDSCKRSVQEISAKTIDMIDDIVVSDFSLNATETRFVMQSGRNKCLFLVDANLTKNNIRMRQQYIFDISTMEFSYAGEPLLVRDPIAYRRDITGSSPRVEESDNWNEAISVFR